MQLSFNTIPTLSHIFSCVNLAKIACKTSKLLKAGVLIPAQHMKVRNYHHKFSTSCTYSRQQHAAVRL